MLPRFRLAIKLSHFRLVIKLDLHHIMHSQLNIT